jgi:hypothetical protein
LGGLEGEKISSQGAGDEAGPHDPISPEQLGQAVSVGEKKRGKGRREKAVKGCVKVADKILDKDTVGSSAVERRSFP